MKLLCTFMLSVLTGYFWLIGFKQLFWACDGPLSPLGPQSSDYDDLRPTGPWLENEMKITPPTSVKRSTSASYFISSPLGDDSWRRLILTLVAGTPLTTEASLKSFNQETSWAITGSRPPNNHVNDLTLTSPSSFSRHTLSHTVFSSIVCGLK